MKIKLMLFLFIASTIAIVDGESFIVKPKKKSPSNNVLKESCGQTCGAILKKVPNAQRSMANMQERIMDMVSELVEGEKNGFFAQASKEQLQSCLDVLESIEGKLEQFASDITHHTKQIGTIEKKAVAC